MPLSSSIAMWYIKDLPGMNSKLEVLEQQDKWAEIAQNCRFENEPGTVTKRGPVSYFNSTSVSSTAMVGLYRYYTSAGITKFVSVSDTTVYVGDDDTGTLTSIRTLGNTGKRCKFLTYKDLLIGSNGYDNIFVYDGAGTNVTWELGSCKVWTGSSNANMTATSISYQVTIDADTYVCGAVSNTLTTTACNVALSHIPLGPLGTTNRKIYRKSSETGGDYRLIATIADNTTTTFVDNTGWAGSLTVVPVVTDDMPTGSEIVINRERLFVTRNTTYPNRIYYANAYLPHFIQGTTNVDYMDISPEDSDEIMGIPFSQGAMVCIKKNTIRRLNVTGAVPTQWFAEDPSIFLGTPAPWSIYQTPYGVIFLGWDHWYSYTGARVEPIIDEFDTLDILASDYHDVVSHWDNGDLIAAYTDVESGVQLHDRVMRFNFKRQKLSYDILKVNCFASRRGDQEGGELYYGSSEHGTIYKAVEDDLVHKLYTKSQAKASAVAGNNIYVGGTENNPYLQLGTSAVASAIPNNICIFWDGDDNNPGLGWTELTSTVGLLKVSATAGTVGTGTTHSHTVSGTTWTDASADEDSKGGSTAVAELSHAHNFTGNTSLDLAYPRHIYYRIFYKNSSTTETEFPVGAIVMYDQATIPEEGWIDVGASGYYARSACETASWSKGAVELGATITGSHNHSTFSGTTGYSLNNGAVSSWEGGSPEPASSLHTHAFTGSVNSSNLATWELNHLGFTFMKRTGETSTWDGASRYVYALYWTTGTPGNGWSEVSSTYEGKFIKMTSGLSSVTASGAAHTHVVAITTTDASSVPSGADVGFTCASYQHTHTIPGLTTQSSDAAASPSVTFRLFRKILGKMKAYNSAIEASAATSGTWYSFPVQIDPKSLKYLSWNERLGTDGNITVQFRTGTGRVDIGSNTFSSVYTDPNAASLASLSVNSWVQYKINFTGVDTTVNNPTLYLANGYLLKYTYSKSAAIAETAVEFIYNVGFRHYDTPMIDKIFQKITTYHSGVGSFNLNWSTEHTSSSFNIDLAAHPNVWSSFFPPCAYGKQLKVEIYKNDLETFKLKEMQGAYAPQPIIL